VITFSTIQKSQLEGASRLDAEYYQPEYLQYIETLHKFETQSLDSLVTKIDVGFVSSMTSHFQDKGIPLLRTQNVSEFVLNLEKGMVYIDEDFHKRLKKSQVFPGYVLLARSGSIGNAAVVPEHFPVANSADIILIQTKQEILPEFLTAFLNSKYGRFQIERAESGGLQGHINLYSLQNLQLPVLSLDLQQTIKQTILEGFKLSEQSESLYKEAENLLLEELGLKGFQITENLSYIVNYSDTKKVKRIDADYFQPKYDKLISKIKNQNAKSLLEVIQDVPARFVLKPDENYRYVELADINFSVGIIDGFSEVLGKEAPSRAKRLLKSGDVIVSSIQGSLEKVALVDKEQDGNLASTGFFQFRSDQILPEVLLVIAKSIILQWQLERECSGTILSAVPQESLKRLIVPVLPKSSQQKIADLVRRSHQARKKSKELLETAKRNVEEMIEKGSD